MSADVCGSAAAYLAEAVNLALSRSDGAPRRVSVGESPTPLPSELIVRELPESMEVSDPVTSRPTIGGRAYAAPLLVTASVGVELWSTRARLLDATADVGAWWQAVMAVVASDRTLGGLVSHAVPYYSSSGLAMRDAQYCAAMYAGVRFTFEIKPLEQEATNGN